MLKLFFHECCVFLMYYTLVCFFRFLVLPFSYLPCIVLGFHMSISLLPYIDFVDGASHSTQNLEFISCAIYASTNELISLHGVCLGHATNNIVKYNAVIELLTDTISFCICHLIV